MIAQMKSIWGVGRVGVYSDYYQWENVFGDAHYDPSNSGLPMWYSNYDSSKSFSGWSSFGSWTSPAIKQYRGDATVCGFDVDLNWAPNWWPGAMSSSPSTPAPMTASPCSPPAGQIACQYKGACGFCTHVSTCHLKANRHAYGLAACNAFGTDESCCVDASSELIDGESAGVLLGSSLAGSSSTSGMPIAIIAGVVAGALVLVIVAAVVAFYVIRRRRQADSSKISMDNTLYNVPEVTMTPEQPKANPTFY